MANFRSTAEMRSECCAISSLGGGWARGMVVGPGIHACHIVPTYAWDLYPLETTATKILDSPTVGASQISGPTARLPAKDSSANELSPYGKSLPDLDTSTSSTSSLNDLLDSVEPGEPTESCMKPKERCWPNLNCCLQPAHYEQNHPGQPASFIQ